DEIHKMHRVDDGGFDDADKSRGNINGVKHAEVPEIRVETVIPRREDRRLWPPLATMGQEVLGVEHIQHMFRGEGVRYELISVKRCPVLGIQEPVFARWNRNDLFAFDLINDVNNKQGRPAARYDVRLRI